jgi:hypothetical protein
LSITPSAPGENAAGKASRKLCLLSASLISKNSAAVRTQVIEHQIPRSNEAGVTNQIQVLRGYYNLPINQCVSYDDARAPTKEKRESAFATSLHGRASACRSDHGRAADATGVHGHTG